MAKKLVSCWWVSAGKDWSWTTFFKNKGKAKQAMNWGGPDWIRSPISFARIRDMHAGDIVIAYQSGVGVVGFARLKSDGYKAMGSRHFDSFDLRQKQAISLENQVPLHAIKSLPGARKLFEFVRTSRGTVFSVSDGGLSRILDLAMAFNPENRSHLLKLRKSVLGENHV